MKIISLIVCLMFCSSSIPAMVGMAVYGSAKNRKAKQEFVSEFNRNNTERESKKLQPLDWCEELFKFNPSMARDDKKCKAQLGMSDRKKMK